MDADFIIPCFLSLTLLAGLFSAAACPRRRGGRKGLTGGTRGTIRLCVGMTTDQIRLREPGLVLGPPLRPLWGTFRWTAWNLRRAQWGSGGSIDGTEGVILDGGDCLRGRIWMDLDVPLNLRDLHGGGHLWTLVAPGGPEGA
jgi:hypothetical protein